MAGEDEAVVVDGWGPLAEEVVAQLRRLRVPVSAGAHACDAAELAVASGGPLPRLLVLVAFTATPPWVSTPSMAAPWHAHRVPVLPVLAAGDRVAVGPLVVPGLTPCLPCVARGPERGTLGPLAPVARTSPASTVLGAAVVSVTALGVLRGDLRLAGVSTEIEDDATSMVHRVWASRPGCGCASVRMVG